MMKLYPWQKECLKKWRENQCRGIARVVTGAGKTILAIAAIHDLLHQYPDLRIRIVVPTIPLASQWLSSLSLLKTIEAENTLTPLLPPDALEPGLYGGGKSDPPSRRLMVYVVNSARSVLAGQLRSEFSLGHHVLLICDECHHYQSNENRKIFSFLPMNRWSPSLYNCIGLSATPYEGEESPFLTEVLGKEIYHYGFSQAVDERIITPFCVSSVGVSFLAEERRVYADLSDQIYHSLLCLLKTYPFLEALQMQKTAFLKAVSRLAKEADMNPENPAALFLLLTYQRKEICVLAQSRIRCCEALIQKLHAKERVLVFCERIEQATALYSLLLRKHRILCGLYHSQMTKSARERVLREFREGRSRILISCRALDEGIDVPDADTGIIVSSSGVKRQRIQRLGRLLRKTAGKTMASLYYLYIPESSEDNSYLPELEGFPSSKLRYLSSENAFINELYEYAALQLLKKAGDIYSPKAVRELRACLIEGLVRNDCLMVPSSLEEMTARAETIHEKNYWKAMRWMHTMIE